MERKRGKNLQPVNDHIGAKIRERRLILGLSQEAFGRRISLTFQQIQKYEKGVNRVSAGALWLIADVLEVPLEYFFEGLDGGEPPVTGNGRGAPREGSRMILELARYFGALSGELQKSVFALVKTMAKATKAEN